MKSERVTELIVSGNRSGRGVWGQVYLPEFSDFTGTRGKVARIYRAQAADTWGVLRRIRCRQRVLP